MHIAYALNLVEFPSFMDFGNFCLIRLRILIFDIIVVQVKVKMDFVQHCFGKATVWNACYYNEVKDITTIQLSALVLSSELSREMLR